MTGYFLLKEFMKNIRNIAVIAHVDHGKTTLIDALLKQTHVFRDNEKEMSQHQILDTNDLERERGITIKLAPVTMTFLLPKPLHSIFPYPEYLLNLIDTPGHVDFNYEVERALQACEGAVLLIDATKGVQAQTVSNLYLASQLGLTIIPAINKIDANLADVASSTRQIEQLLGKDKQILHISAKTGEGVERLLTEIIKLTPPPKALSDQVLKASIFNSVYHPHLGVIAFIRVFSGSLKDRDKLVMLSNHQTIVPTEIGIFTPKRSPQKALSTGSVGYLVTGLKDIRQIQVGDTVTQFSTPNTSPLLGFRQVRPNVYLDIFPVDNSLYLDLVDAIEKLKLNDAALKTNLINSPVLGQGIKVGFLGLLHSEVVTERLQREFQIPVIAVSPSVEYKATLKSGQEFIFSSPIDFPDPSIINTTAEPVANVRIIVPESYLGAVMQLCQNLRGALNNMTYLDQLVQLDYDMPLIEVISSLHDQLKSVSSGFASLEYHPAGWRIEELVRLNVLLNFEEFPPLSLICLKSQAFSKAQKLASKLKESIPRQQFEIPIQVTIGGKIIARETVKAFRKDVTSKLYGGDRTRRLKLLEKQKKGKERMKQFGKVQIPQEAFLSSIKI